MDKLADENAVTYVSWMRDSNEIKQTITNGGTVKKYEKGDTYAFFE
jgi:hypothetical protein